MDTITLTKSIIDTLITDRTIDDVEAAKTVKESIDNKTAGEEAKEAYLNQTMKGWYRYTDLNRVESTVRYLSDLLVSLPLDLEDYAAGQGVAWASIFDVPWHPADFYGLITKINWKSGELPLKDDAERYLSNVHILKEKAIDYKSPTLPKSLNRLTYYGANAIEEALKRLYHLIDSESQRIQYLINHVGIEAYLGDGTVLGDGAQL